MLKPTIMKCSRCGSNEIVVARIKSMTLVVGELDKQSALFTEVCTICGEVVRIYAEHPKKLKGENKDDTII